MNHARKRKKTSSGWQFLMVLFSMSTRSHSVRVHNFHKEHFWTINSSHQPATSRRQTTTMKTRTSVTFLILSALAAFASSEILAGEYVHCAFLYFSFCHFVNNFTNVWLLCWDVSYCFPRYFVLAHVIFPTWFSKLKIETNLRALKASKAPKATKDPAATKAPKATKDPAATKAPKATKDPSATKAPKAPKA